MKTYSFNRLSINYGVPLFVLTAALAFFIFIYVMNPSSIILWTMLGLAGFLLIIIYTGFWARKVQIYEDRIIYKGLNKSSKINLTDIKSIGVFLQLRYNRVQIEPEKINRYSIWGVKFLYISTNKKPDLDTKINDEFICFQYRKSAYELILSRLKNTTQQWRA